MNLFPKEGYTFSQGWRLVQTMSLIATFLISEPVTGAGDGQNRGEMMVLCSLYNQGLKILQLKNSTLAEGTITKWEKIEQMNMSTLDATTFDYERTKDYDATVWKKKKESFNQVLLAPASTGVKLRRFVNSRRREQLNARLHQLLIAATVLKDAIVAGEEHLNNHLETAKDHIRTGLFGNGNSKEVEGSVANDRQAGCGATGAVTAGAKSGHTVLNDLLCLCAVGDSTNPDGKACTGQAALTTQFKKTGGSAGEGLSAWSEVKKLCSSKLKMGEPNPSRLQAGVDSYLAFVKGKQDAYIVGISSSGNGQCAASHTDAACVSYGKNTDHPGPAIPWATAFLAAADELRAVDEQKRQLDSLENQLAALEPLSKTLYTGAVHEEENDRDNSPRQTLKGPDDSKVGYTTNSSEERRINSGSSGRVGVSFMTAATVFRLFTN
ncbi:Variant surface glycoprotein [Trypanosoma congolense IL3000]|uniref:Variant surface glycoprotein n=1 Tax=Trypanosoma congolense (strain IL3000) TaxID=1068625 RepID=F9W423_TRYCI|nr:Variant surface glycoprotein [Trypanosoma congolense IL3000]